MSKFLCRDDILTANDLPTADVYVDEWGGTVRLRTLKASERDAFESSLVEKNGLPNTGMANFRARLIALCAIDENGDQLFTQADVLRLSHKGAPAIAKLYDVAVKMAGMSKADERELVKNSDATQADALPSV